MDFSCVSQDYLEKIREILESSLVFDSNVQDYVYTSIQQIMENYPLFWLALGKIASDPESKQTLRLSAILLLRRFRQYVVQDYIPKYVSMCRQLIENIFESQNQILAPHAVMLLSSMIIQYGCHAVPDFVPVYLNIMSFSYVLDACMDSLLELTEGNFTLPNEIINGVSNLICVDNISLTFISKALCLLKNIIQQNYDYAPFVYENLAQVIMENVLDLDDNALIEAVDLISLLFVILGEQPLAHFLAFLVSNTEDEEILYEGFIILNSYPNEAFSPDLATACFNQLYKSESNINDYSLVSYCQEYLIEMAKQHDEETVQTLAPLIESSEDPGQQLKGIYTIIGYVDNPGNYIPFIESHLNDEYRGDACLCLLSASSDSQEFNDYVISRTFELLFDESDSCIRDKVVFCLTELLSDKFTHDLDILNNIIRARYEIQSFEPSMAIYISQLPLFYFEQLDNLDGEEFYPLFQISYDTLINADIHNDNPEDLSKVVVSNDAKIVASFVEKSNAIQEFELTNVFYRACSLMCDDSTFYHLYFGIVQLLVSILNKYHTNYAQNPALYDVVRSFTNKLSTGIPFSSINSDTSFNVELDSTDAGTFQFIEAISTYYPQMIPDFGEAWLECALKGYNIEQPTITLNAIASCYSKLINILSPESLTQFAYQSINIINKLVSEGSDRDSPVFTFYQQIIQIKSSNNCLEKDLLDFYNEQFALLQP